MEQRLKHIYLVRHAKAGWDSLGGDYERTLTTKGKVQAYCLATAMLQDNLIPDLVYSSSAARALETSEIICEQLQLEPAVLTVQQSLYLADNKNLLATLQQLDEYCNSVMLVGHNPGLETLVSYLTVKAPSNRFNIETIMYPATLMALAFNGRWQSLNASQCQLTQRIDGKYLEKEG